MRKKLRTKVLIIGGGAAGMSAALNLETSEVILVEMPGSNSILSPWNLMIKRQSEMKKDILETGNKMSNREILKEYINKFSKTVGDLEALGVRLKKSNIGMVPDYRLAGVEVKKMLSEKIQRKGTMIIKGKVINFLIDKNKKIRGISLEALNGEKKDILADYIILAAGGIASFFKYSTGEKNVTGSILALTYECGIELCNMEFSMFHPFLIVDKRFPRVLVSGSILTQMIFRDESGKRFLTKRIEDALRNNYHHFVFPEMNEEFYRQALKGRIFAELDCTSAWFEKYKKENEFGFIFSQYKKVEVGSIEIHPAFHFLIGGIKINKKAETSQGHIFAAGEIAGGLHGSNRIGGTAIHEAWIFGKIAAQEINKKVKIKKSDFCYGSLNKAGSLGIHPDIKEKVWKVLGSVKAKQGLNELIDLIGKKGEKISSEEKLIKKIAETCLKRKESIGSFFREDLLIKTKAPNSYIIKEKIIFK